MTAAARVLVGMTIEDTPTLRNLPVGSVVMARLSHGDLWPWVKTDDTPLVDEREAWACVAYICDRTSQTLLAEAKSVVVIWVGGDEVSA